MTISQSSSSQGSSPLAAAPARVLRAWARWRERRRTSADLARLAQVGDYLLRDVGLDPSLARMDPSATLDRAMRRGY